VPLIEAKRAGPCAACGGTIRKGEQSFYTQEGGLRHPEQRCLTAPAVRFRPNQRAGTCSCGVHVPASAGRLVYAPGDGKGSPWRVHCNGHA
jgi:hypothetical protein